MSWVAKLCYICSCLLCQDQRGLFGFLFSILVWSELWLWSWLLSVDTRYKWPVWLDTTAWWNIDIQLRPQLWSHKGKYTRCFLAYTFTSACKWLLVNRNTWAIDNDVNINHKTVALSINSHISQENVRALINIQCMCMHKEEKLCIV